MAHEKSSTVSFTNNGVTVHANVDTQGSDRGRILGGRTFRTLEDAEIEAQTRSSFGHDQPRRNPAARKNPRDKNKPKNPRTKRNGG